LDWFGSPIESPTTGNNGWSTFKIITTLYLVYFVFEYTVMFVTIPYSLNGEDPEEPTWSRMLDAINNAVAIAYAMYLLIVMTRTRAYIRSKYNIPEKDCAGCEDCCFSYFCRCCVVAQMARHINDYDRYSADCCSETGVTASAPELV
jgi:Cys-rich protein (TIGR01571 family)